MLRIRFTHPHVTVSENPQLNILVTHNLLNSHLRSYHTGSTEKPFRVYVLTLREFCVVDF